MRRRPSMMLVPVVLALGLLAGACGGSSGDSASGVATAGDGGKSKQASNADKKKTDPEQAGLDFARCMRQHGVNMPDPDFSKGGVQIGLDDGFDPTSETFKNAQKACGSLFGPGGAGGAPLPAPRARS